MAHRIVWIIKGSDLVRVIERGSKPLRGYWHADVLGDKVIVRGERQLRNYQVREWVSNSECRATLLDIIEVNNR